MSQELRMAEGSEDGTLFAIAVGLLIVLGSWLTASGAFSRTEGSQENGDVTHKDNPGLFSSRSPDNFH